ncbi:amino acid adenylation domain-containing protein [Actinomadura sp. 3N508]|uniref:amino acid adenylation domain-containing protein n=1 Tax=Actinomadura sp. 3N508 TaxID=3375153 RepID=UPI003793A476
MVQDLLFELHRRRIKLRLVDGRLDVLAPSGSLTPELRDELRLRREGLVELLRRTENGDGPAEIVPDPAHRHEPFPLTDIQHAYWVGRHTAVELGGVSTHYYAEFERDDLDLGRLAESLRKVIDRHDMLRVIVQPDGMQRILPDVPAYQIRTADLRGLPTAEQEAEIERVRGELAHQVLPADRWPLFEIRASRLTGRTTRLHVSIDMLIMDAVGLYQFFHDWRRYYDDPGWDPEPLVLSYRDHVLAAEAERDTARYRQAERYWLDRLDTLPPSPALPLAAQPGRLPRSEFHRRRARLPKDEWRALKGFARERGFTPSAVLMTAFADVLRLWSAQAAFTLNLTLFNRPTTHEEIDRIIGDFTSLTMLAVDTGPDGSFADRVRTLQQRLMRNLEHSSFSGVRVLRERARRTAGAPVAAMPVVFTSGLVLVSDDDDDGSMHFLGEEVHSISQTPQVWLDHQVMTDRGELVFNWDCVDALFPPGLLDDMFAAYRHLLGRLCADPAAWDAAVPPVAPPDRQLAQRAAVNDTAADIPARTLCGLVADQARQRPDETAVIGADGRRTYRELTEQAHRLARRLRELGATSNTLVGVVLDKGCDQVAAVLGVTASGAAYLPIDPDWPAARRAELLGQARASIVITSPRLAAEAAWPAGTRFVTCTDPEVLGAGPAPLADGPAPDDLAYVIFTSGSTGTPKGVMIDHRGAANTVQDINRRFEVGPGDRVLALSALSFDLSVYDVFGVLAAGGAIVLPAPSRTQDPKHWTELVERHGVTVWNSVPALMQLWVDECARTGASPGAKLRLALLSGDWIPVALPDQVRSLCPDTDVVSLGGATEASIWSVCYPIGEVPPGWASIPYGKPLANQTLHVYDDRLEPCPVWTTGEIYIGGTGVALGYWADEERTAARFITHPATGERLYRTGDLGRYLPGGDIEFLGRQDHQVKLNGYRIELGEIAAALRRHPGVGEALVAVDTNPATGRRQLVAHVVPAGRADLEPGAVREKAAELLPDYMVPQHCLIVERLPLTANGKVDRAALPSPWDGVTERARVEPRDDLERALHKIWCEALERDDIGVEDNFFELGGDSLHAVRILAALRDDLGVLQSAEDGLKDLFERPTVAGLAATLRAKDG